MDRPGDDFFAGPVLPGDQHIRIRGSDASDGFKHRHHRRSRGNELRAARHTQQTVFRGQPFRPLQRAMKFDLRPQNGEQPLVLPRLLDKIPRSPAHRLDRQIHISPRGHDDDRKRTVDRNNFGKQIQTLLSGCRVPRVVQIDQYRVVGRSREGLARQLRRANDINFVALRLQQKFNGFENMLLIVGGQNAGRLGCSFAPTRRKARSSPIWLELGMR